MFAFSSGAKPVIPALALAALLSLAGCASQGGSQYTAQNTAVAPRVMAQAARVDMEDDGMPAQTPPTSRIHQLPDEPDEPYSRSYGGDNPAKVGAGESAGAVAKVSGWTPALVPKVPDDLPPAFRQKLANALAQDE